MIQESHKIGVMLYRSCWSDKFFMKRKIYKFWKRKQHLDKITMYRKEQFDISTEALIRAKKLSLLQEGACP